MKTGFVCSAFDLCHAGHLLMLNECKKHCSTLIVGLHVNPSHERQHKNSPAESLLERWIRLDSNKNVDKVIPYETEGDLLVLLSWLSPDIRFLGDDYIDKDFTGKELDIDIFYCKRYGYSSSELRKRVTNE